MTDLRPTSEDEAAAMIAEAFARGRSLRLEGGGTRSGMGRPLDAAATLSTQGLFGVTLHEPAELVVSALAGTPLRVVEDTLASTGQILSFEPIDLRPLYSTEGEPTIGGVVAGNWSGPRRIMAGAARDHLIGTRFVNGRGEVVKSGGRVMKNVTGLDLARLQCGANGTLGLLTEVTFKVLPKTEAAATLVYLGLGDRRAVDLLTVALTSPFEVSAAAHLPAGIGGAEARTLLRLENFTASVAYRSDRLADLTVDFGQPERLDGAATAALWADVRDARFIVEPRERAIWRLSVPPTAGPSVVERLPPHLAASHFYDWGGGLIWLSVVELDDAGAAAVRAAVAACGGHATLMRASDHVRSVTEVFQPAPAPLHALSRRIKAAFDPAHILNPGLMHADS